MHRARICKPIGSLAKNITLGRGSAKSNHLVFTDKFMICNEEWHSGSVGCGGREPRTPSPSAHCPVIRARLTSNWTTRNRNGCCDSPNSTLSIASQSRIMCRLSRPAPRARALPRRSLEQAVWATPPEPLLSSPLPPRGALERGEGG